MNKLTELIRNDMKPALGVTEPGAIAFAVASAKAKTSGEIIKVEVALNSGMYKNAFTCGIPNSANFGNLYAAALGAVAARAELGLESLTYITKEDDDAAAALVDAGIIDVYMDHIGSEITIEATVRTTNDICTVYIRDSHTNIVRIVLNDEIIFEKTSDENIVASSQTSSHSSATKSALSPAPTSAPASTPAPAPIPLIHKYSLQEIFDYIENVDISEISFISDAFKMNLELLDEGLNSDRASIAKSLYKANGNMLISDDDLATAQLLCNGAIEARVLGLSKPAMSITGSGAHGIIATMPLYAYNAVHSINGDSSANDDKLLRATALSYLICMYIKEYSGKLSAFCGCGIAAGTGTACGLAYLMGANKDQLELCIQNMSAGLTGMICDGGNHGCAMKGIVATDAAFRSAKLAINNVAIEGMHGINGLNAEDTMRNMGLIASPGMVKTEETIVEIMQNK